MLFLQRVICELVDKFVDQEKAKHPTLDCWYFKGVKDFKKFMFDYLEKNHESASELDTAIMKEENIEK